MKYSKSMFVSLLVFLPLTACTAETIIETPSPTSTAPIDQVSATASTNTEPFSEVVASDPDLIAVKFIDPER